MLHIKPRWYLAFFALAAVPVGLVFYADAVTLTGRITDAGGQPIAGAMVRAEPYYLPEVSDQTPPTKSTVSGADGSYEISGFAGTSPWGALNYLGGARMVPDGQYCHNYSFWYKVLVEADGYVQHKANVPKVPMVTQDTLDEARRLGKALNRKLATADHAEPSGDVQRWHENEGLPHTASHGNTITGIDIALEQAPAKGYVAGSVMDTKGQPASNRRLALRMLDSEASPLTDYVVNRYVKTTTGDDGSFEIPRIVPGRYAIVVYGAPPGEYNGYQIPLQSRVLTVEPGQRVEGFEVRINPPEDYAVSGHVRDARGNPIPRTYVETYTPHGSHWYYNTNDKGEFCIKGLDGMGVPSFRVDFRGTSGAQGFKLAIPDIPLNSTDIVLVVPDKGSIHGVVRDAQTGTAVTTYEITVPSVNLPDSGAVWATPDVKIERNSDGSFDVSRLPAGEAIVDVSAPGLGVQRFVAIVEAGKANRLECDMRGAAVLEGLTTLDGTPKGTSLVINGQWLHSDDDGRFRFDAFPNGEYTVWFYGWGDGWYHRSAEVSLVSGQSTRLEMEMGGSCEVRGQLTFPQEQGPCEVRLAAKPAPGGWSNSGRPDPEEFVLSYSRVVQPGGTYRLRAIPPGRWHLMVGRNASPMHRYVVAMTREIELADGETLSLDIDLTDIDIPKKAIARRPN